MANSRLELIKRGKAVIKRVRASGLSQEFIRTNIDPPISATNMSRFMTQKEGGITEGIITRIETFLDNHIND